MTDDDDASVMEFEDEDDASSVMEFEDDMTDDHPMLSDQIHGPVASMLDAPPKAVVMEEDAAVMEGNAAAMEANAAAAMEANAAAAMEANAAAAMDENAAAAMEANAAAAMEALPSLGLAIPSSWTRLQPEEALLLDLTDTTTCPLVLPDHWDTLAFTEQARLANMYKNHVALLHLGILNGTHDFSFLITDDHRIAQLQQKARRDQRKKAKEARAPPVILRASPRIAAMPSQNPSPPPSSPPMSPVPTAPMSPVPATPMLAPPPDHVPMAMAIPTPSTEPRSEHPLHHQPLLDQLLPDLLDDHDVERALRHNQRQESKQTIDELLPKLWWTEGIGEEPSGRLPWLARDVLPPLLLVQLEPHVRALQTGEAICVVHDNGEAKVETRYRGVYFQGGPATKESERAKFRGWSLQPYLGEVHVVSGKPRVTNLGLVNDGELAAYMVAAAHLDPHLHSARSVRAWVQCMRLHGDEAAARWLEGKDLDDFLTDAYRTRVRRGGVQPGVRAAARTRMAAKVTEEMAVTATATEVSHLLPTLPDLPAIPGLV